jgi:hypothetical protein
MPAHVMARMADITVLPTAGAIAAEAVVEMPKPAGAKSTKR